MEAFTAALQASDAAVLPLMVHLATDAHCRGSKQHMSHCHEVRLGADTDKLSRPVLSVQRQESVNTWDWL